jgi:hypothetical protein
MSPFIIVTPVDDDKQFGLPKTLALNAMHIVSIKPVIGSRPAIAAVPAVPAVEGKPAVPAIPAEGDKPEVPEVPAVEPVAAIPAVEGRPAVANGEIGSLVETVHGSYRVHEVIADFMKIGA